jgi:cell division protein FtsN
MSRAPSSNRRDLQSPASGPGRQRGSLLVGLVIGLLMALVVALYITKAPVPFVNKVPARTAEQDAAEAARNRDWDPNAPLAGKNPSMPHMAASEPAVLPPAAASDAAALPATPPSGPAVRYFVQAGAFSVPADAESRRASLALLGFSGKVSSREQNGRTLHRVRIGPFDDRAQAEDAQDRLAGSGIEANLVRVER